MDLQLTDKVIVVTGASKGIGLAVATRLVEEGARVVAASRTSSPDLDALAGERLVHVAGDLSQAQTPADVIARATERFGRLDGLVNNVGGGPEVHGPRASFLDVTDEDWRATIELNLLSTIRASRAALPLLLESAGSIVNISSVNARRPFPMVVDYSAAKAAVSNLTKALSEEFAARGVRVNAVSPGPVRTPFWTGDGAMADALAAGAGVDREVVLSKVVPESMGLTTGTMVEAEEVADLVAFLVSPRARNTTGVDHVIDSGFLKNS